MAESADLEEKEIKMIVYAGNRYDHDAPYFGPIFLGGSGKYKYKDANGEWVPRCETTFTGGLTVPGMDVVPSNMTYEFAGQYGEERLEGKCYFLVGRPQFSSSPDPNEPYKGSYEEEATSFADGSVIETTYKYFVWVDDAYDMYTNATTIVYPKLINQSAQGSFIPDEFIEGYISPFVDAKSMWENGDIWIVANSATDSSATPRGIYRLDVENMAVDDEDTFHVTVYYYNSNRRTKLGEQTFLIAPGMRQLTVGNFPSQTEYASYYIVIQVANISSTVNTALKYRLRIGRTKPIILVHGINSRPHNQADVASGIVFCDNLHQILESNYYCKCYFLCHDAGRDDINDVLKGYRSDGRTGYYELVQNSFNAHDARVSIFAHSEGTTLTRIYASAWEDKCEDYLSTIVTVGGVHLGSAFATLWCDAQRWFLAGMAGCSIQVKNILEIGGAVSLHNRSHPLPSAVTLYACNGAWGSHPESYMESVMDMWYLPRQAYYNEIRRTYRDESDGMVPNLSACPRESAQYVRGLLTHGGGVAHDERGGAHGPNTETHVTWQNFGTHPTYKLLRAALFNDGNGEAGTVGYNVGCVMLPNLENRPGGYFANRNGMQQGRMWWQDNDGTLSISGTSTSYTDMGAYMLMAPAGQYAVMHPTQCDVYTYFTEPGWTGYITNGYTVQFISTNVLYGTCTVQAGRLTIE